VILRKAGESVSSEKVSALFLPRNDKTNYTKPRLIRGLVFLYATILELFHLINKL